jgi:two-component system cell cycle response regulator
VTISVGIAGSEPDKDTAEALLRRADQALYRAKREGRNRVVAAAA